MFILNLEIKNYRLFKTNDNFKINISIYQIMRMKILD